MGIVHFYLKLHLTCESSSSHEDSGSSGIFFLSLLCPLESWNVESLESLSFHRVSRFTFDICSGMNIS